MESESGKSASHKSLLAAAVTDAESVVKLLGLTVSELVFAEKVAAALVQTRAANAAAT